MNFLNPDWIGPRGSTYADDIDLIINVVGWIVMPWFLVALGLFLGFTWKFRKKPGVKSQYIDGSNPNHKKKITLPHNLVLAFDVIILVLAVKVWYHVKQEMPPPDTEVKVVAQQWAWTFVHAGADNTLGTGDDIKTADELHVPLGKNVKWTAVSPDVLHSFSVPVFRLKQDVIPGREITGWFNATKVGVFDIQCTEICGIGHGVMGARVVVETPEQYEAWQAKMLTNGQNGHVPFDSPGGSPTIPTAPLKTAAN